MPKKVGGYNVPGNALGVAVSGNYVYVADGHNQLVILYVSDGSEISPQPPELPATTLSGATSQL
ncbi:hypothetical protein PN36_25425 [Candidatus Thiomargarita nelsonii]|uniref:NHL repeat containing protein n=1 Tax=Candidatus Thiomargarita nelsonii TaxID=1003181 RepID=A0A0A6P6Y0_9GAMM|nr:hypothetical protein PN36_25425 [Candidatus Thiomargarita nelsonii]